MPANARRSGSQTGISGCSLRCSRQRCVGVCMKTQFLTCFPQDSSGLRSLALSGKHTGGLASCHQNHLIFQHVLHLPLRIRPQLRERVRGGFARDAHTDIIIIPKGKTANQCCRWPWTARKTQLLIHISGYVAYKKYFFRKLTVAVEVFDK